MQTPLEVLQAYYKNNTFRPQQEEIISNVLLAKDTLALLPTGGGKSVCYHRLLMRHIKQSAPS